MIAITTQIVTPMMRLVLEWDPVDGADRYVVKLRLASAETAVSESFETTKVRLEAPMMNASWYHYQVLAKDGDNVTIDSSVVTNVWTSAQYGTAVLLRQAVHDAVIDAGLSAIDDGFFQPRAWGKTTAPGAQLPAIEVLMPGLLSSGPFENNTKLHTWNVPINIIVSHDRGDPDRQRGAWLLFELVQDAIDDSGLKLTACGVLDEDWTWSASLVERSGRGKATKIEAALAVPVRKFKGCILLPQPDEVPEEPETPEDL